jgi:hypothetical protein
MSELSINKPTITQQNLTSESSVTTITITTTNNDDTVSQEDDWQLLVNRIYLTVDSNIPNDLIQILLVKIKEWFAFLYL